MQTKDEDLPPIWTPPQTRSNSLAPPKTPLQFQADLDIVTAVQRLVERAQRKRGEVLATLVREALTARGELPKEK